MAKKGSGERWRRVASDAALVSIYAGVVLAVFGGFAREGEVPSLAVELALLSSAIAVLVASGLWLDRMEARREGVLPEE